MRVGMTHAPKQSIVWFWPLLPLVLHAPTLSGGSEPPGDCSGRFVLEDSTVKLILQQYINSTENAVDCRYTFEAPEKSGLLVIANDIRAVNDGEIPGCPVSIYGNVDARGEPVFSLCGHYSTLTIPVPSSAALVVYKPEFLGTPYTLTLDLQVASTGGSNLRACGDSQLNAVSAVPVRYSLGFRADAGSGDASDFCDLNVTSKDETLGTKCVLTSDGVCSYEVLLSNGSAAELVDFVDLATDWRVGDGQASPGCNHWGLSVQCSSGIRTLDHVAAAAHGYPSCLEHLNTSWRSRQLVFYGKRDKQWRCRRPDQHGRVCLDFN